jgi:ABC-type methionine transport system ATPase subunit
MDSECKTSSVKPGACAQNHQPFQILQEHFVGLDPESAFTLKEEMKVLCAQGSGIFFSTHVLEVAEKLCTKVAIIQRGRLAACGETAKVIGDNSLEHLFMELIQNAKSGITMVVKQSASALVTFVVEFASVAVPMALYLWLRPAGVSYEVYGSGVAAMVLLSTALLWHVVRTWGVVWFQRLCCGRHING